MNAYFTDQMAREHADRLMADAAAARRLRRVRQSRRAVSTTTRTPTTDRSHRTASRGPATAHLAGRPFAAFRSWFAAGQL
jgi:hypothetical protein